jgi:hypothetical protein
MVVDFHQWLTEGRQYRIPPPILHGYEQEFRRQLLGVIERVNQPTLKAELERMVDCPIRDRRGHCRSFTDYIHAALIRNGIHHEYDVEAALQYVVEKMLLDRSEATGEPRASLFNGFEERPDYVGGNPLVARFLSYLEGAVRNIRKGRIPRLLSSRRDGVLRIGQGRARDGERTDAVLPDELPGRADQDADLGEMVEDITGLLRRKEGSHAIPLVALFQAMLGGMTVSEQRRRFGDGAARSGRQVILQTIEEYARSSGNATSFT